MNAAIRVSVMASTVIVALSASSGAQAQVPPQSPNMTFFVTSTGPGKGADLGGITGADEHCQRLGTAAGAGDKAWRAYLSTNAAGGSINARDRIGRGPWQNFKGGIVAKDADDLHSAVAGGERETNGQQRRVAVRRFSHFTRMVRDFASSTFGRLSERTPSCSSAPILF